jgi:membrane dipeptidase
MNQTPIFDGHNDTLLNLLDRERGQGRSFFEQGHTGHLDLPRARAGGLKGGIFAIFCPPPPGSPEHDPFALTTYTAQGYVVPPIGGIDPAYAERLTNQVIDLLDGLLLQGQGQIGLVRTYRDLEEYLAKDILAILLHFEGAEAIHENLDNLEAFYQRGLRSLGLVWSRPNVFGRGIDYIFPGSPDTGAGLTPAGKELVRQCNRLGIQVDLAHINEKGFWDVAAISDAPLVVSHIGVHALSPASRNLTDAQIDRVGETGGIVSVMFEPSEIRADGHPEPDTPLSELVRHVDYLVQRIGIDHVGLGSDFDGAMMPKDLPDAAALPNLVEALKAGGYQGEDLQKITYKNWLRVLKETLKG